MSLTVLRNHREGDDTASLLDKLDNVVVRELDDGAPVDRRDAVANVQQATSVSGTALDDAANLVRNHWKDSCWANETEQDAPCDQHSKFQINFINLKNKYRK